MKTIIKKIQVKNVESIKYPIIPNGFGWTSTERNNLSVIESGEKKILLYKIVKMIESAEQMICLQSFLIQNSPIIDALLKAVEKRKVKVFVLGSAEARIKDTIEEEQDFIKSDFIDLLQKNFKNKFIYRVAENFHAKFILVDPKTKPKGFLCTNNFTLNGFNKNPELAIELSKSQSEELFKVFVYHFWEHATDEQTEGQEFDKVKPLNRFNLSLNNHILLTSPNKSVNTLHSALLSAVKNAQQKISFSTFLLDKNIELIKTILDKAKQGVDVILFCRPSEKQFNEHIKELLDAGVKVFFHPFIHAKSLLIDNIDAFIFTANLIEKGLETGFEVGTKLSEQQTKDLFKIHANWEHGFPLAAVKEKKISDLKAIEVFNNGKLEKKILIDDNKEQKRVVKKVNDLIAFFNQKYEIKDPSIKTLNLQLIAEIEELPSKYTTTSTNNYEIIESGDEKNKIKILAIKKSFPVEDLQHLTNYNDCLIYST
jgi:phosphatidylserine/phosphatidylglycerophosphate/cardiolipin synthase-like enzyme